MSSLSFIEGAFWGGVFCAALSGAITSSYYLDRYADMGFPSPVKKVYRTDTNHVTIAKRFLHKRLGYGKYMALVNSACYDQVLDEMLLNGTWSDIHCYELFSKIVEEFKGGFREIEIYREDRRYVRHSGF
tara:strand:- start:1463 stop:1852 length:390 start_codon:yes stop_codon:yes gene_type:complete